jgi:acetylornithine deacetylase/succinyl-diaminopimelate desuccinylase-like protein
MHPLFQSEIRIFQVEMTAGVANEETQVLRGRHDACCIESSKGERSMYDLLKGKLEGLQGELMSFAQALLRTRSLSRDESSAATLVERQLRALDFDTVTTDSFGNVVGVLHGVEDGPNLLLASHMDTVEPADEAGWPGTPWSGRIEDGKLHGLGAADCKGGLAAQVFAGGLLKRSLLPLRGNLIVAATVAEENGISLGMRGLIEFTLKEMGLRPEYAILGEPTDLGLYYGHDGRAELDIRLRSNNPFQVADAAELVASGMGDTDPAAAVQAMLMGKPHFEDSHGLRCATIAVERRLGPEEAVDGMLGRMRHEAERLAQLAGAVEVEVAVRERAETMPSGLVMKVKRVTHAWSTDPFSPLLSRARQSLAAAGCAVRPGKWKLSRLGMGTSGSVLSNEFHIPTIGYGPGREEEAHSQGESVEIAKIVECTYGTAAMAHGLVGIPVFGWIPDEI